MSQIRLRIALTVVLVIQNWCISPFMLVTLERTQTAVAHLVVVVFLYKIQPLLSDEFNAVATMCPFFNIMFPELVRKNSRGSYFYECVRGWGGNLSFDRIRYLSAKFMKCGRKSNHRLPKPICRYNKYTCLLLRGHLFLLHGHMVVKRAVWALWPIANISNFVERYCMLCMRSE